VNSTEIIRQVCETARHNRCSPEIVEHAISRLLLEIEPEKRLQLRRELDNAVAAIKRELEKEKQRDLSGWLKKPEDMK
jgi:hypothetical protein